MPILINNEELTKKASEVNDPNTARVDKRGVCFFIHIGICSYSTPCSMSKRNMHAYIKVTHKL